MRRLTWAAGYALGLVVAVCAVLAGGVALTVAVGLLAWALSIALAGVWM